MSEELDKWLFEHAQLQGHRCDGIKNDDGINIAWEDSVTGERIYTEWATDNDRRE